MKITRNKLRQLIREAYYDDTEGFSTSAVANWVSTLGPESSKMLLSIVSDPSLDIKILASALRNQNTPIEAIAYVASDVDLSYPVRAVNIAKKSLQLYGYAHQEDVQLLNPEEIFQIQDSEDYPH